MSGDLRKWKRLKNTAMSKIQIIPAILATTEEEYSQALRKIEDSGRFKDGFVQVDLMDGEFVANKSIGVEVIAKNPTELKLEAHLMVENPSEWVGTLVENVSRVIAHIEVGDEAIKEFIQNGNSANLGVGLAINPETPVEKLKPYFSDIDAVLVMSVHPGFQGQEFIPETLEKVKEISHLRSENNFSFKIEVDGGINKAVAKDLIEVGADNLVVGSHWEEINV